MAVRTVTFQVALLVIVIVGIILIIQSSWTLAQLNKTIGDDCACSGTTDQDLNSLRIFSIITMLMGIGIIVYAVIMYMIPTKEKRHEVRDEVRNKIAERFSKKEV
jgi:hypothetical protein